jgi:hypothetical protein
MSVVSMSLVRKGPRAQKSARIGFLRITIATVAICHAQCGQHIGLNDLGMSPSQPSAVSLELHLDYILIIDNAVEHRIGQACSIVVQSSNGPPQDPTH